MSAPTRLSVALVALGAALLLGGCAGSPGGAPTPTATATPAPTETATPTATPTPAAAPAVVIATAHGVQVLDADGGILLSVDYAADPTQVVSRLEATLGESADRSEQAGTGGGCSSDRTYYDFGGLTVDVPGGVTRDPAAQFTVEIDAARVVGIPLETVQGITIGGTVSDFLARVPDAVVTGDFDGLTTIGYDILDPSVAAFERIGAIAHGVGGRVTSLAMPYYISGDC